MVRSWHAGPVSSLFEDLRWRGLVHQTTDPEHLPARLDSGRVVAYIGFDPTADSLHVGHLQQLCLLRRFQAAGHQAIALVGGGTGMIGDPSGKSEERNLLSTDQLERNRAAIHDQIAGFLGEGGSTPAVITDNYEWLSSATLLEFLRDVGKLFSVNEMIRKDSVRARLEGREQSLSFTEFSYMLLQSWDFVQLFDRYGCELQLGGSDQWGNITEGVDLIRRLRGATAYGLTSPLVTKADGTKFGKTESGSVWLDRNKTSPYAFYQFWLRTVDADTSSYLRRFTMLDRLAIEGLEQALVARPELREAQRALAFEMTAMVHGRAEAERAEAASAVLFTEEIADLDVETLASALEDAPTTHIEQGQLTAGLLLEDALLASGLAGSRSQARRLLASGSVYINGRKAEADAVVGSTHLLHGRWVVLRRGKHRPSTPLRSRAADRPAQAGRHFGRLVLVPVAMAGPEKATEAVLEPARHDVQVDVRDALADHVVQPEEGPVAAERVPLSGRHPGSRLPHCAGQVRWELGDGCEMDARDDQRMPGEDGASIQERDEVLFVEQEMAG
jgi:tyrosyl-tRNA synthetase